MVVVVDMSIPKMIYKDLTMAQRVFEKGAAYVPAANNDQPCRRSRRDIDATHRDLVSGIACTSSRCFTGTHIQPQHGKSSPKLRQSASK